MKKIGTYTMAITLIAIGCAVLADRLAGGDWLQKVLGWWPGILILLGIEMVILKSGKDADGQVRRFDGKVIVLVVAVFIASQVYNTAFPFISTVSGVLSGSGFNWGGNAISVPLKDETMPADGVERLLVDNTVGQITVVGSERSDIHWKATARVHTSSQSDAENRAKQIHLETSAGRDARFVVVQDGKFLNGASVDLEFEVPSRLKAEIKTNVGSIEADSLAAVKISDNTGSVKAVKIGGDLEIKTTTGKIDVEHVKGKTQLETTTGFISAKSVEGSLDATATTGRILFEDANADVRAKTTTGSIEGNESRPIAGNYELNATTGRVSLQLPSQSSASFSAHTNTGAIDGSLPWNVNKQGMSKDGTATLGSGQYKVDLRAATGHISVNAH